ncbi:MAG: 4Fe-4S binding protein [Burkholderiaceae bacterium]|nr:4Fe-4S binding protein [Burkholderiaceae bacterium]
MNELLRVNFAGVEFLNPYVVAASPLTTDAVHILEAAQAGWGGAVTKTVTAHPAYGRNLTPALSSVRGKRDLIGLGNNEVRTHLSLREWCDNEIPFIKKEAPSGFVLIGSIMEGVSGDHWAETAFSLELAGVDILELNVSCPHGMPEKYRGSYINDDPELLKTIIECCKNKVKVPIVVKLNALCKDLVGAIGACIDSGADGISSTNTLLALPSIDIYKQSPGDPVSISGNSTLMGYSGPGIRPFGLHSVAQIALHSQLPISGCGGIECWENGVEYVLAGSTTLQVATAAMVNGLDIIDGFLAGTTKYLNERNISDLMSIKGKSLPRLLSPEDVISTDLVAKAQVNDDRCTVCNKCIMPCHESASSSISLINGKISVNQDTCTGCGLCIIVCPFDALKLGE